MKLSRRGNRTFLQTIGEFSLALIIFTGLLLILPQTENPTSPPPQTNKTLHFVFHDSAEEWEEFFENNDLDDILSGELKDQVIAWLDEGIDTTGSTQHKSGCFLPWGGTIAHGENVLAYQQRDDVNTLCNVERRICDDGKLLGSFTQKSCKEHVVYEYSKEIILPHNEKNIDPLVQPVFPPYRSAHFTIKGKRNKTISPTTTWDNTYNNVRITETLGNGQSSTQGDFCRTPRGEKVNNRQFVKAYASAFGFTNAPCEVELRYCDNGQLKGSFEYQYCEYTHMSWEDFILQSQKH